MDLNKQILAMGFPSARILFLALAKHFDKEYLNPKIEELCHIQDIGCFSVDYYNKLEDKKCNLFIILKDCKADHDLTFQLDKLKVHLDDDKWKDVLSKLSALIVLARTIYSSLYNSNKDLFEEIVGNVEKYSVLQVDISNTTLYLPDIDDRVGIFLEYA